MMGLYSNARRMTTMFCAAIIFTTLVMLALRLTVFSDLAVAAPADSPEAVSDLQGGAIEGNSDFPYKLNGRIYFPKPDANGNVLINNPAGNKFLLSINIILPETKDSLYYTGTIAPGTSIESAKLSKAGQKLANGVYECIAEVSAVDPDSMTRVASEKKDVTIYIGEKP